jgi:hypothetical protein
MKHIRALLVVGSVLALAGAGCSSAASVDETATTTGAVSANIDAAVSSAVNDSDSLDHVQDASLDQSQYNADDAQLNVYSDTSYDLK